MWVLAGAALFTCHRMITSKSTENNILSDSTKIANGKAGMAVTLDTTAAAWLALHDHATDLTISKVKALYQRTGNETVWLGDRAPTELYFELVSMLRDVYRLGLLGTDYDLRKVEDDIKSIYANEDGTEALTAAEIEISKTFFKFTTHLTHGRIKWPGHEKKIWKVPKSGASDEDVERLADLENAEDFMDMISALKPKAEQYIRLEKAYQHYLHLDSINKGTFDKIKITKKIKPGVEDIAIPSIRTRIQQLGGNDKQTVADDSLVYDNALVTAVKTFQERHGLRPDGIIGAKTVEYLNRNFRQRAAILALNMERLRWMPDEFPDHYITVNIPEYKLRVFTNGKEEFDMKVVVGNPETPTPVFSDMLERVVFSPTWTIPKSIIEGEIIPRLQENPDYYAERNYIFYKKESEIDPLDERWDSAEVDPRDYVIVQQPGADNALGQIKFVMPNNLSIYLHDTPQKRLFKNYYRAYSHGCIRVEQPVKLAAYLLTDHADWNEKKIRQAMHGDRPTNVFLKDHYEVHLIYQTAWVDDDGNTHFRDDIYGHDRHQLWQLYPEGMGI